MSVVLKMVFVNKFAPMKSLSTVAHATVVSDYIMTGFAQVSKLKRLCILCFLLPLLFRTMPAKFILIFLYVEITCICKSAKIFLGEFYSLFCSYGIIQLSMSVLKKFLTALKCV